MAKPPPSLVVVAQIVGAFGVKGEARVRSFTADPEACFSFGPLLDEAGGVVLTPERHRPLNEGYGVTAREKRQREEWDGLRGTLLYAPSAAMPEPEADEVYVADLIGQYDALHPGYPVNEVVGYTNDHLLLDNRLKWWSADEYPWSGNNTAGNWICDAVQWKAAALFGSCDLSLEAGCGVRSDIVAGPIKYTNGGSHGDEASGATRWPLIAASVVHTTHPR